MMFSCSYFRFSTTTDKRLHLSFVLFVVFTMNIPIGSSGNTTLSKQPWATNAAAAAKAGNKQPFQPSISFSGSFSRSPIVPSDHRKVAPPVVTKRPVSRKRKKRQPWTEEEDQVLFGLVRKEKTYKPNWPYIAARINEATESDRTGKQCRERWQNHLRPNIKKGGWTVEEEEMIRNLHKTFGPKWSCMSKLMKNRTDNDIKNKWNSMVRTQKLNEAKYGYYTSGAAAASNNRSFGWAPVLQSNDSASVDGADTRDYLQNIKGQNTSIVPSTEVAPIKSEVHDDSDMPKSGDKKSDQTTRDLHNWEEKVEL